MSPETTILTGLAQNGPWAAAAAFLLWQVLKAWNQDRDNITKLMGEFKDAINGLTRAVEQLGEDMEKDRGAIKR